MTDKQIIIDGCDVSGCSLYEDNPKYRMWGTCDCMRSMVDQSGYDELAGAECKGYNCYYKQLKHSEAQCEDMFVKHTDLEMKYKQKEQECEFSNLRIIQLQETLSQYETDLSTKDCIVETCKAQYKELKAELEQYKKSKQASYEQLQKRCNELELENRKLEAELEEIKTLKDMYFTFYKAKHDDIKGIFFKYKQTLTEIKEIAEGEMDSKEFMVVQYMLNGNVDNKNKVLKQILQKISEVLDEEV